MPFKRPWNRAKIFQPFDALSGLRELLHKKELEHEQRYDEHGNEKEPFSLRERTQYTDSGYENS